METTTSCEEVKMAIYAVNQPSFHRSACLAAFLFLTGAGERGIKGEKKKKRVMSLILKRIHNTKIIVNGKSYGFPHNTTKQHPNLGDDE